jgi:hypothetical protein
MALPPRHASMPFQGHGVEVRFIFINPAFAPVFKVEKLNNLMKKLINTV